MGWQFTMLSPNSLVAYLHSDPSWVGYHNTDSVQYQITQSPIITLINQAIHPPLSNPSSPSPYSSGYAPPIISSIRTKRFASPTPAAPPLSHSLTTSIPRNNTTQRSALTLLKNFTFFLFFYFYNCSSALFALHFQLFVFLGFQRQIRFTLGLSFVFRL